MKKMKNKKALGVALGAMLLIVGVVISLFAGSKIVFAQGSLLPTLVNPIEVVAQTEVEVNVKYIFEDEKVFKEEKIKAEKGQLLDSGDLPMLPDDMKFIDDFLFYEVKADGKDEIIRKVEKIDVKDKETQTENESSKSEQGSQSNSSKTENKGTQTELSKDDISKMEKESKELKEKLDKLNQEIKDKEKLSDKQKDKIKDLEEKIDKLKEKLEKGKDDKDLSADMKKEIEKLTDKIKELEKKANEVSKAPVTHNPTVTPTSPISGIKQGTGNVSPQTSINSSGKGSATQESKGTNTKDTNSNESKEKERQVRYPNKLTPKQPDNNGSQDSSLDGSSKNVNTNKGVASAPSKARGAVTENKDNVNNDYPIHHNDSKDNKETDKYSADARQFVTFTTKNGKTFHLIINHDEDSENVMLLTEVSEDDLLNLVEKKAPEKEIVKEEPQKEEPKPVKKEESSNTGTYLILILVVLGALGAGYYFKVIKKKEDKELEGFEEEDDDFFSSAEETENEVDESETEDNEVE